MNLVTVEMGRCTFVAPEIPMNGPAREVVKVPLQVDGETLLDHRGVGRAIRTA